MNVRSLTTALVGWWFISSCTGDSSRKDIHHMMYQNFDNPVFCFRRFNGTHQFGCSSHRSGNFGAVIVVSKPSDLDILQKAVAGPYMVALDPNMFNNDTMSMLVANENVSGILVLIKPDNFPQSFSPDDTCPNRYFTNNAECDKKWNPYGNQFLLKDWRFPIFLVNNPNSIKNITDCAKTNEPVDDSQLSRALCSLHMKSHMFGTINSETCIRRSELISFSQFRFCDPMGDQNIYLSLGDVSQKTKSVMMISARLDAASIFDGTGPGAMSAVTGIVTFLVTAHTLSKMLQAQKYDKSAIFTLFNGESYDYIGSSRVVYDMDKGFFPSTASPISFDHLMLLVDISQLDLDNDVYLHFLSKDNVAEEFSHNLTIAGDKYKLRLSSCPTSSLPPSALHSFHQAVPNLPGVIISNYKEQFINKYYNGMFDNEGNIKFKYFVSGVIPENSVQKKLANISLSLAYTLYRTLTEQPFPENEINSTTELVNELLYCYLENSNCKLIQAVISGDVEAKSKPPLPLYVGVAAQSPNRITTLTGLILASLTSPRENMTHKECSNKLDSSEKPYSFIWMNGLYGSGECIKTTLKFTPAVSPAFQIEGYDWTSRKYSTWTESVWQEISLVKFVKPSRSQELITFGSGVSTMILSFIIIYWISHRGQDLFLSQCPVNC